MCSFCVSCVTVRVQQPTALTLVRTIEIKQLRLPADTEDVMIYGICGQTEHVLLVCDVANRSVKSVSTSTDALSVTVCSQDAYSGVYVQGCMLVDAADGQFTALAEITLDRMHHQVAFAGPRDAAGLFAEQNVVQLPDERSDYVCIHSPI